MSDGDDMTRMRIAATAALGFLLTAGPVRALGQPPAGGAQVNDYVPVTSVPAAEQLPAAPMVIGAYAFLWVVLLAYVFFLWRKMKGLERELADLQKRVQSK